MVMVLTVFSSAQTGAEPASRTIHFSAPLRERHEKTHDTEMGLQTFLTYSQELATIVLATFCLLEVSH